MSLEQNKALVRRFYESFGANDLEALKELLAPELVAYSHGAPGPQTREMHLQGIRGWNAAFDTSFTIEEQIAEEEAVATRITMRAVHKRGSFQGLPPSGKEIVAPGVSIERIHDGKIVERQVNSDWVGMMQQLGIVPSTSES